MVQREEIYTTQDKTTGDALVSGLLAGFSAGLAMLLYLLPVEWISGEAPLDLLRRFSPSEGDSPLTGLFLHLAVAGIYGMFFGLLRFWISPRRRRLPGWLAGLLYSLVLLVVAELILLPGSGSSVSQISLLHFTVAHIVYGLVLGVLMARR